MAILNLLALESTPYAGRRELFAILVGGDLGPRLLPTGSLAGLIWLEGCRKSGVKISLRHFQSHEYDRCRFCRDSLQPVF